MIRRILSLIPCLLLFGCSSSGKEKLPEPPSDRWRIAVIPKGLTHEHWKSVERGAKHAAEELSKLGKPVEIVWDGPRKESDAAEQIALVDQKVGMGLHGLVLAPQHSKQMIAPVQRAVESKVAVVILDSDLDDRDAYLKYIATNNYNGGVLAAKYLLHRLDKKGVKSPNLVLFRYQKGSESTEQREKGFLDQLDLERKAGRTINLISDDAYAGATVDSAQKAAAPMLAGVKSKGVDGIFAVNESATSGLLTAMEAHEEIKERALIMGFDMSKPLLDNLRKGEVIGLVAQNPYRMGYLSVWHIFQHLEGYDISDGGKLLSTGEIILTADKGDADGKGILHLDDERAEQLFKAEKQPDQKLDLPKYKKK